ncbi:T9SS type A sorting domain-containing protein [Oceanihabitans sp. 2_MG-2023]|uniref:T9SS type A sorting domain-containing protein n=1 Tax=Oceanihabitans sp. 2_MG-2023 TaxID=3062661 RepID=UPI0026E16F15|nr:T9SS type A sorting domain-containing protein [Oceanihabitans sp. 2_MG-2023]MDO6597036.1 T9SS type A sorting domain-containing protein [Oceanihabitans sp. 2_MG-2023]
MKKNYILFFMIGFFVWSINGQITLTQSNDAISVTAGGVGCWSQPPTGTGEYRENSFFRAYNLADFSVTEDFEISSVEYGQGTADDGKLITCNIYAATSDDLNTATLTLLGTATHISSSADDLSLISVALTATIPSTTATIAFEVLAGDSGTNINETFFPGINTGGENDDSYLKATACGITTPTPATAIGFSDNQYVMNVIGNILSVEEFSLDNSISIYPNPTSNILNLNVSNAVAIKSIELYNVIGKQVIKTNATTTLDLTNLESGIYMLKVDTDLGSITKKVIRS